MAPRLLHVFATFAPGGPQVRTARLMNAFGGEWEHAVLAMDGVTSARDLVEPRVALELLETPPKRGSLATTRALRGLLRAVPHDLLLTYNWGSMDAAFAARSLRERRWIHHEDGFLPDETGGYKRRRIWTRRLALRGAAALIVPSRNLERIALELWRLPRERVFWIPNGIRVEDFAAQGGPGDAAARAALGVPADAVLVGSVGHLRGEKNFGRLLAAVERLGPEVHLCLVGDGPERAALEKRAGTDALRGRVHFAGHREDLGEVYRGFDVFALSSDTEQMPVALIEAMAAGLSVAATDVGDVRVVLPEGQGRWVVGLGEGDVERLAGAIGELCGDAGLRRRLGEENFSKVQGTFTFEGMLGAYRERYREAIGLR